MIFSLHYELIQSDVLFPLRLGWEGDDCSKFQTEKSCPQDCNGRGVCVKVNSSAAECHCVPGYTGDGCEKENVCNSTCNGNGVCKYGRCFCYPGFGGEDCSGPEVCSRGCEKKRGTCIADTCICLPGFTGEDCSIPTPCLNCTHGTCFKGKCACLPGYTGNRCDKLIDKTYECPKNCSGKGQ